MCEKPLFADINVSLYVKHVRLLRPDRQKVMNLYRGSYIFHNADARRILCPLIPRVLLALLCRPFYRFEACRPFRNGFNQEFDMFWTSVSSRFEISPNKMMKVDQRNSSFCTVIYLSYLLPVDNLFEPIRETLLNGR